MNDPEYRGGHDMGPYKPISRHAISPFHFNIKQTHAPRASLQPPLGNLRKQWKFLVFLHAPPRGGPYCFFENLTVSPKPYKTLVK